MSLRRTISIVLSVLAVHAACAQGGTPANATPAPGPEQVGSPAPAPVAAAPEAAVPEAAAPAATATVAGSGAPAEPTDRAAANPAIEVAQADPAPAPAAGTTVPATGPLSDSARAPFLAMQADPDPEAIVRNSHYWVSNEGAHYVWRDIVADRGGALVGVGTDQMYLLAGWQKPAILIPLDFDQEIVQVHMLYGIAFRQAATVDEFLALWKRNDKGVTPLKALMEAEVTDPAWRRKLDFTLRTSSQLIFARLRQVQKKYERLEQPSFLTDTAQYDFVRSLWVEGRVFPIRGDLTADITMQDLARALRTTGVPLRGLYLSNAEQYFENSPAYRRNILVQPFDDRSLVLRTQPNSRYVFVEGDEYHYNHQDGANFQRWMRVSRTPKAARMLDKRTKTAVVGVSVLDLEPTADEKPPTIAPFRDGDPAATP